MSSWNPASATIRSSTSVSNPEYKAQRESREGSNKRAARQRRHLKVPVGTIVYDEETGAKVWDFSRPDSRSSSRTATGGRGNARSPPPRTRRRASTKKDARRRARLPPGVESCSPMWGTRGISERGQVHPDCAQFQRRALRCRLSLPTLQPNLGVVAVGDTKNEISFVVADIPA